VAPTTGTKFETESLSAVASGAAHSIIGSSTYSGLKGTLLASTGTGPSVTYTVNVAASGTYNVKVAGIKGNNRGKFQLSITGVNQGAAQDQYSASATVAEFDLGNVVISTAGQKAFKFTVVGKNALSSDYRLAFDYIRLTRQ
jgi:hypothetical protein